ncbi:ankyrin repeat-containing domain protein [Immersiella caudata]|uniref:Ankyrin repeat-containing domain protein n=1 Tax=Immersiella caudata TaxID=314043 RepID=A0AA39WDU9_9PEZI|nr:ankyrin repeat-containing domain protein [Immersiella caudata]
MGVSVLGPCSLTVPVKSPQVDVNLADRGDHRYPIHQAAQSGHLKVVETLLEHGADPDPVDDHGITALWSAAQSGHYEIVKMILDRGGVEKPINIETESDSGERRAIHQAAQGGYLSTVELLLAKGAFCDPEDEHGITPFWSAAQNGNADVVHLLLGAGAKMDVAPYTKKLQPIHVASLRGHLEVVRLLLDSGVSPTPEADSFDDSEPSPFLLACTTDNVELARLFLDRGVDIVNTTAFQSNKGALHFAAHGGHVRVGQFLLDNKCDVDAREAEAHVDSEKKDGATALWIAAQQGHSKVVKRLLAAGAKQLSTKSSKRQPVHQAAQNGHLACVKLLVKDSPEEISMVERQGFTALTLAA